MNKTLLAIFILLPLLAIGQANKLFRQGLRATDPKEKINLFTQVIDLEPKNLDAYFYRALAKNDIGDFNGAILDYTKIIFYNPDADSYYNRGNSKYSLEDFSGAKDDYIKALELDPNFIDARYNLACANYFLEEYESAIKDLTKVIQIIPREAQIYTQRANAYFALNKFKLALQDYSLAILIEPNANTFFNRGITFLDINYYQQANEDFTESLNFNPNDPALYFYRGVTHVLLGKYDKAIYDFSTTLKYDSLNYETLLGLALTYYKMDDLENAKIYFEKAKTMLSETINEANGIDLFKDTYWYKKQFYFFNENFETLNNL